ncbi:MAG: DUF58 domain-containing protein [Spirochaetes bacterium]|nr:DUF58 domain-containing protein [Spirochaetota bacterium]
MADHKEIIKNIRRLEIKTSRVVDEFLSGQYHSVFKGRGMEFDEVREYVPGDDVRDMDWNVTARYGIPFIKRFREERELTVMLVVDTSASTAFGSSGRAKSDLVSEIAATLAFSAIKNNDKVGLILFSSVVEKYLAPKKGKNHILNIIREIVYHKPAHKGTSLSAALEYVNRVQKRKAVVFLISDFFDAEPSREIRMTNRRHDLIAIPVDDPRERELPAAGIVELADAETGETMTIDTFDRETRMQYTMYNERRIAKRTEFLKRSSVDAMPLSTDRDYVHDLVRFFKMRARRAR